MLNSSDKAGLYYPDGSSDFIVTAKRAVPVTLERLPYTEWNVVKQPGVARAYIAATEQRPEGTTDGMYTTKHADKTVLQQHCAFFDLNGDGIITPYETYISHRLLGWGILLSLVAMCIIHSGLSYFTLPPGQWLPDPFFRIFLANVHQAKHGSDTGAYDNEGRFRPQQFADFFSKYGEKMHDGEWGISYKQALAAVRGQRCIGDAFGTFSDFFEWSAVYLTIWPDDGFMRMEDIRGVYDGSYFFKVAGDRRAQYTGQYKTE